MALSADSAASFPSGTAPPYVVGLGFPPSNPSCAGLGFYPAVYRDPFPSLRARFDASGYPAFIPEGTFKVEEARLEDLKEWSIQNQKREEARLKAESELEGYILSRASSEAKAWKNSLDVLDIQRQIAEVQLTKTNDETLDDLIARKALADAERAEREKEIMAGSLTRKARADADRAEAEVALVKCQHEKVDREKEKLEWEIQVVQAEKARFEAETAKFEAEKAKFEAVKAKLDAETKLIAAQLQAIRTVDAATAAANPLPSNAEKKEMIAKLEEVELCPDGYRWEDIPGEEKFRCKGGGHIKTYEAARAMFAKK